MWNPLAQGKGSESALGDRPIFVPASGRDRSYGIELDQKKVAKIHK